jgi:transcriptional regulator with XRE-family HTH domain
MPARTLHPQPLGYLHSGQWPDGRLTKDAPREALLAAGLARRLRDACGERSLREISRETGVGASTLSNLLGGRSWGDVVTVVRLESTLGVDLWGDEHRTGKPDGGTRTFPQSGLSAEHSGPGDLAGAEKGLRG